MGSKSSLLEDIPTTKRPLADIPASRNSSLESFSSIIECTPEPHGTRPQTALQCLDHTIGIVWHCFDAFRQQIFTVSPESVQWAVDFLEASTFSSNDELHFVVAYLRCVQALVQLIFRKSPNTKESTIEQLDTREHVAEDDDEDHATRQQEENLEQVPDNLIEELLRLYALLARYKEEIQHHQQNTIELNQLQEIEHLLQELNESFEANSSEEEFPEDWLRVSRM